MPGSVPKPLSGQCLVSSTGTAIGLRRRENIPLWIVSLKLYFPLIIMMSLAIK